MERAYERACQAYEIKQAAQRVQQGGSVVLPPIPTTPGGQEEVMAPLLVADRLNKSGAFANCAYN